MKAHTHLKTSIFPTALKDMRGSIVQWEKETHLNPQGDLPQPHTQLKACFFCAALSPADLRPVEQTEVNKT